MSISPIKSLSVDLSVKKSVQGEQEKNYDQVLNVVELLIWDSRYEGLAEISFITLVELAVFNSNVKKVTIIGWVVYDLWRRFHIIINYHGVLILFPTPDLVLFGHILILVLGDDVYFHMVILIRSCKDYLIVVGVIDLDLYHVQEAGLYLIPLLFLGKVIIRDLRI